MLNKKVENILEYMRLRIPSFQRYINTHYKLPDGSFVINGNHLKESVCTIDGNAFFVSPCLVEAKTCASEYQYNDIQKNDVVVDIGGNIGGFSIIAAKKCSHIFILEPLFAAELRANLDLNEVSNYTIIEKALGPGFVDLVYGGVQRNNVECISLSDIIKITGRIDFLKMDCEGAEWSIIPDELKGIRHIEAEIHSFNGENVLDFVEMLKKAGFEVQVDDRSLRTIIVHGQRTGEIAK